MELAERRNEIQRSEGRRGAGRCEVSFRAEETRKPKATERLRYV